MKNSTKEGGWSRTGFLTLVPQAFRDVWIACNLCWVLCACAVFWGRVHSFYKRWNSGTEPLTGRRVVRSGLHWTSCQAGFWEDLNSPLLGGQVESSRWKGLKTWKRLLFEIREICWGAWVRRGLLRFQGFGFEGDGELGGVKAGKGVRQTLISSFLMFYLLSN